MKRLERDMVTASKRDKAKFNALKVRFDEVSQ